MFKMKKLVIASSLALGLGMASSAQATLFQFNPQGNGLGAGLVNNVATIDQAPGNALALGGVQPGGTGQLALGTVITDLYQANLNSMLGTSSNILYANGLDGNFFTFVVSFNEVVTGSTVNQDGSVTNTFSILPGTGFFKMCDQAGLADDLTGTGFACAGNGILSGTAVGGNATQTGFPTALVQFDQSPDGNQYGATQTVTSSGAANLTLQINFADANFFPSLNPGVQFVMSMVNSSLITPFNQVNPSSQFSINGVANGGTAAGIGAINGITGPNFQFQADANQSFVIPEPGTLALLGLGFAGLGGLLRRRKVY